MLCVSGLNESYLKPLLKQRAASCPAPRHPAPPCPFFGVNLAPGRQGGAVLQAKIPLSVLRERCEAVLVQQRRV